MIGNAREGGVAAVLDPADQAAHLLHFLPRLLAPAAAQLVGVGRVRNELLDQIGGREPVHPPPPARPPAAPPPHNPSAILGAGRPGGGGSAGGQHPRAAPRPGGPPPGAPPPPA